MDLAVGVVSLVAVVTLVSALCKRGSLPAPLVLTTMGLIGSFIPGIPDVELTPELVLIGLLPPLLYAAALNTSLVDFRHNARPILLLSVGLVIFSTLLVGVVVWWVLPVPPAVGFAVGAVVAPPDAVAATSIARRVGLPRRVVTILEGESLVNDATALVALRTAIAAISGSVTILETGLDFLLAAAGGVLVGVLVALVTGVIRRHIEDEKTETAVSLLTPFISYLIAEEIHVSGVLAVVITGLILAHRSHLMQSASSRIFERTTWVTIQFLLENTVFLLIGLQVRSILAAVGDSELSGQQIALACLAVLVTATLVRPAWVFPAVYLPRLMATLDPGEPAATWRVATAISWAGMRGVVTLAAVFTLPVDDTPHRDVLILIALVVVFGTLMIQGSTLPFVIRRLGLSGPDPAEDALQEASVHQRASAAGLAYLESNVTPDDPPAVVERLQRRGRDRALAYWERLGSSDETPSQAYARLRLPMIAAERGEVLRVRDQGLVADEVLRRVLTAIDLEETIIDRATSWDSSDRDSDLVPQHGTSGCEHLEAAPQFFKPQSPEGCSECQRLGWTWVHLRLCLSCGRVGCCDSSRGNHATAHFHETDHPVIRSFEPGEAWRWCYVDDQLG